MKSTRMWCLATVCAILLTIGCGDNGGPQMTADGGDAVTIDAQSDSSQPDLVINPDIVGRDLAGVDTTGLDLAGVDTTSPDDTFVPPDADNTDAGQDATTLPDCTDSAQCAFGNICLNRHCTPGCLGDRDCSDGMHCKADALPHGACLECVGDEHCTDDAMKCRNGQCVSTCATSDDCAATPAMPYCETNSELCVQCLSDGSCPEGRLCIDYSCVVGCKGDRDCPDNLRCDPKVAPNGDCFPCIQDADCNGKVCRDHACVIDCSAINCPAETPVCDPATGNCLDCLDKTDCRQGQICMNNFCVTGCENDDDCGASHCNAGSCVECTLDEHCTDGKKCRASTCSAAECYKDSDCGNGEYCHPLLYSCEDLPSKSCDSDNDCVSWIPGFLDEHCDALTRECVSACLSGFCLDLMGSGRDTCVDGGCYGCQYDSDCPGVRCSPMDRFCHACASDNDCAAPGWHCAQDGNCFECLNNFHCGDGKVCDTAGGNRCVECLTSDDCDSGAKPICGKSMTCIPACVNECSSGEQICNEDYTYGPIPLMTCGDHDDDPCLEYGGYTSCGSGAECVTQGDGQGECVCNDECTSGQKWCATGETDVTEKCVQNQTSGCWYISTGYCSGSYGEKCSGGECVCSNECTVDQTVCTSSTAYKKCVEDYYTGCPYWASYTCNSGYYCSSGKCQ
ncbi:MAG TPA: hypothetical protein PKG98_11475 [Myxococcota bacterium]|nr:hypothetical protein [Myxococcota bacterium]